jgi:hypothetical protein
MSYRGNISYGVLGSLKSGGGVISYERKNIYKRKVHKCLDCPFLIAGGERKKRCSSCSDKYTYEKQRILRHRRYIRRVKNNKHKYSSKYFSI